MGAGSVLDGTNMDMLLSGIRAMDLADEKASFCTRILADMGVRVIKVERPGGDPSRAIDPFRGDSSRLEEGLSFQYHNANKLGVTLDLDHREGREIFRRLIERNDVLVESFPPRYLEGMGLGFDVLNKINPRLIMVSVSGFGQNGPRSWYKSCDLVASAFGGHMYVSGSSSSPPLKVPGGQSYYAASLFGAIGILLAIRRRMTTGAGGHVDISLQEAVLSTLDNVMVRYFFEKIITTREGGESSNHIHHIFPCKDGHFLMTPFQQWETLVELMEKEGMAEDLGDPKYAGAEYRLRNMDHIFAIIKQWTTRHTREELFQIAEGMRFPWAPILSPKEVFDNPQLEARGFFQDLDDNQVHRPMRFPGLPYRFSSSCLKREKRAPRIGEDNVRIYHGELDIPLEEMERLSSICVI